MQETIDAIITPETVSLKNIPKGFGGAIFKYDLKNNLIFNKHFVEGKVSTKTDIIKIKKNINFISVEPIGNEPVENNAPLDKGCSYITIDWYWQTWENGILVNEEFLYSSNVPFCNGGTGGGGGGGSESCAQINENFVNQGAATSGTITTRDDFNNGSIWRRSYNWPIFTAGTWGLLSYEKGTLEKVHYSSNNTDRWEFTDFTHVRIAEAGTVLGGSRTFVDVDNTINISASRTSAWVRIDFSVTSKANCLPGTPLAIPYNSNKTFTAPNIIIVGSFQ